MKIKKPLRIALTVFLVWMAIIMLFPLLVGDGEKEALDAMVTRSVRPWFVIAPLFLLVVVALLKWRRGVGLKTVDPPSSWMMLWLPMLFVLFLLAFAVFLGLPPATTVWLILVNTLLVGISEELMFRGVIFYGALRQFEIWPAVVFTSLVFGAVHALNGFATGDFAQAGAQAVAAALSGFWFIALRLRTNSLYPGMLMHGLWDFAVFMVARAGKSNGADPAAPAAANDLGSPLLLLGPILFVAPLFLYGLWLLRDIGRRDPEEFLD